MRNPGLDEAQAEIKIARRNINNLRYADDTTLMAESEELRIPILWPPDVKSRLTGKTPMLGKIKDNRRRGQQKMRWFDGIIDTMDMSLSKL